MTDILPIIVSIFAAVVAGGIIGLERSYHGRPAGFRTHTLVCLSSSILMLVTVYEKLWFAEAALETVKIDPTRMAQGVMTGIGFLGAGVIVKEGFSVRGLTTAASIWITAAIGIVCGVGLYYIAIIGTVMTILILSFFRWIEDKVPTLVYAHHSVKCARKDAIPEDRLRQIIKEHGISIASLSYSIVEGGAFQKYEMTILTRETDNFKLLSETLAAMESVIEYRIAPAYD